MSLSKRFYFIFFLVMHGVCYAMFPPKLILSTTFSTFELQNFFKQAMCPGLPLNSDSCKKNLYNLNLKYHFDVNKIASNRLGIQTINAYRMDYSTTGVHNEQRYVSAALLVPQLKPDKIKGIILFYHSSTINKSLAPSDYTIPIERPAGKDVAAVYASQGYIVIAPDYIGLGQDKNTFHPFILFPKVSVMNGLNALKNSRLLLDKNNILTLSQPTKLFIVGFSEGGAYALWTSKILQDSHMHELNQLRLNLVKTIGMSGVYDVSNAEIPFLIDNVQDGCWRDNNFANGSYMFRPKCMFKDLYKVYGTHNKYYINSSFVSARARPILATYALASYAYYRDNKNYARYLLPEYYNLTCKDCKINGYHYNLDDIFVKDNVTLMDDNVIKAFHHSAVELKHPGNDVPYDPVTLIQSPYGFKKIFGYSSIGLNNSILSFIQPAILHDQVFKNFLQSVDIYKWHTNSPITLIYLSRDSVVTSLNSIMAKDNILPHDLVNTVVVNTSISPLQSDFVIGLFKLPWVNEYVTVGVDHQTATEPLLAISLGQMQ